MDADDVIQRYPLALDEKQAGVMDSMNMSQLTRIQCSYWWQPHLPFMPVKLENHPWTWHSHVNFFSLLVSSWCGQLALALRSVDYIPDIRDYSLTHIMDMEKKARGYFWYCWTLISPCFRSFCIRSLPNQTGEPIFISFVNPKRLLWKRVGWMRLQRHCATFQ